MDDGQAAERRRVDDRWQARMENKMDAMTDALTKLVAVETHQIHILRRMETLEREYHKLDERIHKVDNSGARLGGTHDLAQQIFMAVVVAGLSIAGTLVATGVVS